MSVQPATVASAVHAARSRIAAAGGLRVELVAVTKGFGAEAVAAAVAAGCVAVGENYAQEMLTKRDALEAARRAGVGVHFVGRLQSNKVRQIAGLVDVWESVDRSAVATAIAGRSPGATVLVQVNPTVDTGKGGCPLHAVGGLIETCVGAGLLVDGLMTVGPTTGGPEAARPGFRAVRRLVDEHGLRTCSMGMTDDLEVAIEEGSTRVRLGTALFGARPGA